MLQQNPPVLNWVPANTSCPTMVIKWSCVSVRVWSVILYCWLTLPSILKDYHPEQVREKKRRELAKSSSCEQRPLNEAGSEAVKHKRHLVKTDSFNTTLNSLMPMVRQIHKFITVTTVPYILPFTKQNLEMRAVSSFPELPKMGRVSQPRHTSSF